VTLSKAELAVLLFEKAGLNKREAREMVNAFFEGIPVAARRAMTFHPGLKPKNMAVKSCHEKPRA
jgi:hypothetical protein